MQQQLNTSGAQDDEPERYYEWMLWRMRKEDEADKRRERSSVARVDSDQG